MSRTKKKQEDNAVSPGEAASPIVETIKPKKPRAPRAKKTGLATAGAALAAEAAIEENVPTIASEKKTAAKTRKHAHADEPTGGVHQAEVNIGMVGHVDHGKCIALDEPILLNNDFSDGTELLQKTIDTVQPQFISESERLFDIPNFRVFSLDPKFELVSVPAKLFVQNYSGPMIEVTTKDGKRIKASPQHPLLVNSGKEIIWKKASELKKGDYIGALKKLPESTVVKDPFPNWIEELRKTCWVVIPEEAMLLSNKTANFTNFEGLTNDEWNGLRIIARKSIAKLEESCGIFPGFLAAELKKEKLPKSLQQKLITFFKSAKLSVPENILVNIKSKSKGFLEIRNHGITDNMLRFLSLIIAESNIGKTRIHFSQDKNVLLGQFFEVCKKEFELTPCYQGHFGYHLNNKSLIEFLKARYGITPGNSWNSGIPHWIFALPNNRLAIFLRTFFSAEGNVNPKSGQIALVQANKQSIQLIGYALKKFGISHSIHPITKYAANTKAKTRRVYWQLIISGLSNLRTYKQSIGFDLQYKNADLEKMCLKKENGKRTDRMTPIDHHLLSELISLFGLKKKIYSERSTPLNEQRWFFAYQDSRTKNAISEMNLDRTLTFFAERLEQLKDDSTALPTRELLSKWAISQNDLSIESKLSPKIVFTLFGPGHKRKKQHYTDAAAKAFQNVLRHRYEKAKLLFNQIQANVPTTVEWCKIAQLNEVQYAGPIIDLQVPGYHNFAAGTGALISHNSTLVQTLTGKWTSTHSEELKRGISIRLGYADATFYEYPGKDGPEKFSSRPEKEGVKGKIVRKVSFIDAPGHETLMTTMLSGAALMQGALLVIAANEPCPQPRTAEHLLALQIGGIQKLIVVQNKVDLVDKKRALESHAEIKKFLGEHGYENAPIIPVSANFGANIDLLIQTIQTDIPTPVNDETKPLKMYISRSFDVNKPGTPIAQLKGGVLGGSILTGVLVPHQKVEMTPGIDGKPIAFEVQSLNIAEGTLQTAHPGGLIAVGTLLEPGLTSMDKLKGQILCAPGSLPKPTDYLSMEWHELPRLLGEKLPAPHIKELMVLTVGTNTLVGEVVLSKKTQLDLVLKGKMTIEKDQKIAISRRDKTAWRLAGWGAAK